MKFSPEYIRMCQEAIELNGCFYEDKRNKYHPIDFTKSAVGLLQNRGIIKGDYLYVGINHWLKTHDEAWSFKIKIAESDCKLINEDEGEIYYFKGGVELNQTFAGLTIGKQTIDIEYFVPIWEEEWVKLETEEGKTKYDRPYFTLKMESPCVWWLPRLDQLIELCEIENPFCIYNYGMGVCWTLEPYIRRMKTFEEIWLSHYMWKKYGKAWENNTWIQKIDWSTIED